MNTAYYYSRNRQRPPPEHKRKKDFGNILARRGVSGICRRQIALLAHRRALRQPGSGKGMTTAASCQYCRRGGLLDSDDPRQPVAPVTGLRMPATASPDSSESPRRLVVDVLNQHGSCTTWDTTGFYWQQLELIPVGQAGCSPLQVMLWLGRLCSLLIADSSLAGYCQQSAHLEAVFCCKHSARYVFHRWFALLKFFLLLFFLAKSSTATSFGVACEI
ncbi:hypothetical protein GGI43DRAFT_142709 [Trichoderma evansii]